MKISYKWLLELTGLDWSPDEVADRLTLCGTACEDIESTSQYMEKVVVAEVLEIKPIEGADKIRLATVNDGTDTFDVVCGAPNVKAGLKVALAQIGAKLAGGIVIKKAKIRGVESIGMICSERELGLSEDHAGIIELSSDAVVGQTLVEHLDFEDQILTFELTPNRADSLSAIGIARDLATLAGKAVIRPEFKLNEISDKASDVIKVSIVDSHACPRYCARVIKDIKIEPSPWWMQKKLITAGMRPINNVVDITNFVMLECGQPLHAFDLDRFGSDEVVVRLATKGEKFTTLDENEHELGQNNCMITDGKDSVAVGGVMGGLNSEVEDTTTNILLEAAYFDASMIRKSRKVLGMVTESSTRFEKGTDPNGGVEYAIDRAAYLLQEICGGKVLNGIVDCYPDKFVPPTIDFRPERCNEILGSNFTPERMAEILTLLECKVEQGKTFKVTVPSFRPDLEREIDLIEEVVRIQGFNSIEDAVENIGPLFTPTHFEDDYKRQIRTLLTGIGFDEMIGHGLAERKIAEYLEPNQRPVEIVNPVSEDINVMRTSLAQTILGVVHLNISRRNMDLKIFEIGQVYFPPDDKDNWVEEERLSMIVSGNSHADWRTGARPHDFYDLTGALNTLWGHFHLPALSFEPEEHHWFESEISFVIKSGDEAIGRIGKISVKTAKKLEIKESVFLAELSLSLLIKSGQPLAIFKPLPIYPSAPRDLAIVVDISVRASELVSIVRKAAGELAETVELFDVYAGKQIEKGKKSIAVSISYRSSKGNLSSEEVDEKQKLVIKSLQKNFNAEIRDK